MSIYKPKLKEYSGTILKRYDKGINTRNAEGTGVIEWKQID